MPEQGQVSEGALARALKKDGELAALARCPRASDDAAPRGMARPAPLPSAMAEALAGSPETMDGPRPLGARAAVTGRLRKHANVATEIATSLREKAANIEREEN